MKYAILMYAAPSHTRGMSGSELDGIARKHARLRDELTASGELAGGAGLVLPDETVVLRLGAEPLAREGPLSGGGDDEEHLTAYYEVDCETLDRAKEIGAYVWTTTSPPSRSGRFTTRRKSAPDEARPDGVSEGDETCPGFRRGKP